MYLVLHKDDQYADNPIPVNKVKKELRCFSRKCTGDALGTSTRGIAKKPVKDGACPDCGDYMVWKPVRE